MDLFIKKSRYWQQKLQSFTPKAPPSLADAFKLFDHLAGLAHITFDYPLSGCEARAHLMCCEMIKRGYLPRKAWVFEDDDSIIHFPLPGRAKQTAHWAYHVAPVVMVDAGPAQGGVIPMVFDPGLFDGPVTPAIWADAMGLPEKLVAVVPLGHSPPGHRGDYLPHTNKNPADSLAFTNALTDAHAQRRMSEFRREMGGLQTAREVFSCTLREPQYTAYWRTVGVASPTPSFQPRPAAAQSPRL